MDSTDMFSIEEDINSSFVNKKIRSLYKYIMASLAISITAIILFVYFKVTSANSLTIYNRGGTDNIVLDYNPEYHSLENLEKCFYTNKGITHDVFVKQIHSHNDYWRNTPLLDAISLGVQSVEADVWYFPNSNDETVYVGHSLKSLKENVTLDNLYLEPLAAMLRGANNRQADSVKNIKSSDVNGVFDTDHEATLYLFIDFKTDGELLFDRIHKIFEPFLENSWLSYYNTSSGEFEWGPITVIGTGNTPLNKVKNQGDIRYIFFDGPLNELGNFDTDEINHTISPIVSSSLRMLVQQWEIKELLTEEQVQQIKTLVDIAHDNKMKTRIWDTPWWPVNLQKGIWKQIVADIQSDYLNVDDLKEGVEFTW